MKLKYLKFINSIVIIYFMLIGYIFLRNDLQIIYWSQVSVAVILAYSFGGIEYET